MFTRSAALSLRFDLRMEGVASHMESDLDPRRGGFDIGALRVFEYAIGVAVDLVCRGRRGSMEIR